MKVIVDCDTGNDDAWAIISLLRAEHKSNYKVLAITCVHGNTAIEHSALNNLLILETLNRLDIPVYKGAESGLIKNTTTFEPFHGPDGLSMIYKQKPSKDLIRAKHAVMAIKDYIDEVTNSILRILEALQSSTEPWRNHNNGYWPVNKHRTPLQALSRNFFKPRQSLYHGRKSSWGW